MAYTGGKFFTFGLFFQECLCYNNTRPWGYSSAGRALEWHSRGHGFESHYLHIKKSDFTGVYPENRTFLFFSVFVRFSSL